MLLVAGVECMGQKSYNNNNNNYYYYYYYSEFST